MRQTRGASLLAAACAAAARGFSVIPLAPGRKTPAIPDWSAHASSDPEQLRRWWQRFPEANIGVCTGQFRGAEQPGGAALLVVDLDTAHGGSAPPPWTGARGGWDVLAMLAAREGVRVPDDTYTVRTASGGFHLYYRQPPGPVLRNSQARLGWRIDTRGGTGGYCVGAGSITAQGRYTVVCDRPIAVLPAWLHARLTPPPPTLPAMVPRAVATGSVCRRERYVAAVVRAETAAVRAARTGQRHTTLLRAARILGEFVGGGLLAEPAARAALQAAAAGHIGIDDCTEAEVTRTITDGLAFGSRRPRDCRDPGEGR